ncbi:hypothetical protein DL765_007347 [Monosporascus sp. GIB2]|nr:hypothetical protein DL765_007347 [Monosporascus sp. GIB2]
MATTNHPELDGGKEETLERKYIQLLERHLRLLEGKPEADDTADQAALRRLSISVHRGQDLHSPNDVVKGGDSGPPNNKKIQYRMKRYNQEGFQVEEQHDPQALEDVETPTTSSVATFVFHFDRQKNHYDTEIKIESEAVRSILQERLKQYPGYHWMNPSLSIFAPFQPLIHNWDTLTNFAKMEPKDEGRVGLTEILNAVRVSKEVKEYFETRESEDNSVGFDFLWTIFPPGEFILLPASFMKQNQVFIVREVSRREEDYGERKYMAITCWAYDWDGQRRKFNRVAVELKIEFYKGKRLITSLPCYPLKCYTGSVVDLRQSLIKRGERFRELCMRPKGKQMFEYDAPAYFRGSGVRHIQRGQSGNLASSPMTRASYTELLVSGALDGRSRLRLALKGKVMVDFESYVQHGPSEPTPMGELSLADGDEDDECRCDLCVAEGGPKDNQKYGWDANDGVDTFCEDQYLICPPRVLGYHLMEKKWVELQVDRVKNIEKAQVADAFEKLELSTKKKELIEQLVRGHTNDKMEDRKTPRSRMEDLTKGPPGVGKTLTAESIAQATEKPLFPIGVGDVTTDPSLVEKRLEQLFELAEVWQAVMLLSFDIAVQSRINLAIKFEDLTERQKTSIFRKLVNQLEDDYVENKRDLLYWMEHDEEASRSFSKLNGRQVRNIIFSAASLAGNRGTGHDVLKLADIKKMLDETVDFQKDLYELTKAAREKNEA